jgi:hypothetical protein
MINRSFSLSDIGYGCAMLLTVAGIIAMGADNSKRLAQCESAGRGQAECRLLVLGR